MTTTEDIIHGIILEEGGYVDNPADKGGPTKYGITIAILTAWRHTAVTAADLQALSAIEAFAIYMDMFVKKPRFDLIADPQLQACVVDAGVQHNPQRAITWLQQILGVTADGVLGPQTISSLNAADPHGLRAKFIATRVRFYGRIVADDANKLKRDHGIDTQGEFDAGWMDRVAHLIEAL